MPASRPPSPSVAAPVTTIRFWGVRGSLPSPGPATNRTGGNTPCVEIRVGEQIIIIDAGTGIRALGLSLAREFAGRPLHATLLISHTHWDHIQGFPFFTPAYHPLSRIRVLACENNVEKLKASLSEQMQEAYFPVSLGQLAAGLEFVGCRALHSDFGLVTADCLRTNHPGFCLSFKIATPTATVVYLTDHEGFVRKAKAQGADAAALAAAEESDREVVDFVRGADVLIADGQFDPAEYSQRVGWGHMCVDDAVDLAIAGGVKRLYLFHHDPDHDDARIDALCAGGRKRAGKRLIVEAAREGMELVLGGRSKNQESRVMEG